MAAAMTVAAPARVEALLEAIHAEQQRQTALLEQMIAAAVPPADRLVRALRDTHGADPFDAPALVAEARVPLSTRRALRAALAEVVDVDSGGAARRLGRWLARHRDHLTACGFRLEKMRETRTGALYRVVPAAGFDSQTRAGHAWP